VIHGKKVCVVMPAYNAGQTLERTVAEFPQDVVDDLIVVDDASTDATVEIARRLGLHVIRHPKNRGYGANQKTCYAEALSRGADIVIMVHPDYQYDPRLVSGFAAIIASGVYSVVMGSRILGVGARKGGMPLYKYVANRALTFFENVLLGHKLSEYHSGYRAFSREVLELLPLEENDDGFVFDNQVLAQAIYFGREICEVTCPTKYFPEASSISFWPSVQYGFGVLKTSLEFRLAKWGILSPARFSASGRRLRAAQARAVSLNLSE
jgi:glycosyltransferase involved in cell wall biosynthesis